MENCGIKIILEKDFKSKFLSRINSIQNNNEETIYTPKFNSNRKYLNFINAYFGDYYDSTLKLLIESLILKIEMLAPRSSDLFLDIIVQHYKNNISCEEYLNNNFEKNVLRLSKLDLEQLTKSICNLDSQKIIKELVNIIEYDDKVFVDSSVRNLTLIKKTNQLFFDLKYDLSFLTPFNGKWDRDYFKFIIIDGFIDSVGEIHHILHKASEDKEPYVIFCKGMREEVKHTILHNLKRKTIDVLPVCFEINEENVNILNDIASCLNSDIVTSTKGDIISVECRRELNVGKKIRVNQSGFYLYCENKKNINRQLRYIKNKINFIKPDDPNFKYLENRIKTLESKKIEIFLGKYTNKVAEKDLDYFLKLLLNSKSGIVKIKNVKSNNKKMARSFYSLSELNIIFKNTKSLFKIIENLGCLVVKE